MFLANCILGAWAGFLDRDKFLVIGVVVVIVFLATSGRRPRTRCPKCGEFNRDQASYCAQCGTRISNES